MIDWLAGLDMKVQAALIAGVVGLATGFVGPVLKHVLDRWSLTHRLDTEHRFSQRKKLRELISHSHGRLIEAANNLNYRFWNLQANQAQDWLKMDGSYDRVHENYYFTSTVHRVLAMLVLCREFDKTAVHVDGRIAEKDDLLFVKYVKALQWVFSDGALFKGVDYDAFCSHDHIFSGKLEVITDIFLAEGVTATQWDVEQLLASGKHGKELRPLLAFLDGLNATEPRLRWDRVVCCHLILMAFLNTFGYDFQHTDSDKMGGIAATIQHREIRANLDGWLPRLGIDSNKGGRDLAKALKTAETSPRRFPPPATT